MNPYWLEEPTHADDIAAHRALMDAGIPVAVGEAIPNAVMFKNFFLSKALSFCQV